MQFYKKWWFWTIVVLILIVIFFPKSCGGSGGMNGIGSSIDCTCFGAKASSLLQKTDAQPLVCYGICLKSSCKTTIYPPALPNFPG